MAKARLTRIARWNVHCTPHLAAHCTWLGTQCTGLGKRYLYGKWFEQRVTAPGWRCKVSPRLQAQRYSSHGWIKVDCTLVLKRTLNKAIGARYCMHNMARVQSILDNRAHGSHKVQNIAHVFKVQGGLHITIGARDVQSIHYRTWKVL